LPTAVFPQILPAYRSTAFAALHIGENPGSLTAFSCRRNINQYLRAFLRAASDFFFRFTLGFS
jgi:hypothetical protein